MTTIALHIDDRGDQLLDGPTHCTNILNHDLNPQCAVKTYETWPQMNPHGSRSRTILQTTFFQVFNLRGLVPSTQM
eukprot:1745722-Karenia_brevis.AAC.1